MKKTKRKELYIPHSASEQSQSPHSRGPHEVQIGIFSVFIFHRYFFGQYLENEKKTLVKAEVDINT